MRVARMADMTPSQRAKELNELTSSIIAASIRIHQALGPGLLETAYLACLCYELRTLGLQLDTQKAIPLVYGDLKVDCAYRADLLVGRSVVVEVKAVDVQSPLHARQLHTYVKLAACPVGLLLNFGAPTMREGIKRIVNRFPE